ncbi:hypothetical protein [Bacillus cytotoxicus]|uniref:Uncharacterized protein n=1 Tax=Bacillus cytotoxicus TaxID=580165 RepID=A0AAX2CE42_9BACI|nr:hypothetical protein [Bacillus cytotoxicus]SCL87585.1 Protein of unknown function [Bacillus cytotoxicus]SCN33075.1 Protein of unknown function [Bacillus cytotoxicus]
MMDWNKGKKQIENTFNGTILLAQDKKFYYKVPMEKLLFKHMLQ